MDYPDKLYIMQSRSLRFLVFADVCHYIPTQASTQGWPRGGGSLIGWGYGPAITTKGLAV